MACRVHAVAATVAFDHGKRATRDLHVRSVDVYGRKAEGSSYGSSGLLARRCWAKSMDEKLTGWVTARGKIIL
jgi:hypothetical protein